MCSCLQYFWQKLVPWQHRRISCSVIWHCTCFAPGCLAIFLLGPFAGSFSPIWHSQKLYFPWPQLGIGKVRSRIWKNNIWSGPVPPTRTFLQLSQAAWNGKKKWTEKEASNCDTQWTRSYLLLRPPKKRLPRAKFFFFNFSHKLYIIFIMLA